MIYVFIVRSVYECASAISYNQRYNYTPPPLPTTTTLLNYTTL